MRERSFPVRSLGSAKPSPPAAEELGKWILDHAGKTVDLTTWEIETSLHAQLPAVTHPACGGMFYQTRVAAAFSNISDHTITAEFDLIPDDILADCSAAEKISRRCWWAVPSPQALHYTDAYFGDADDASAELADAVTDLCRLMRDAGTAGHVLIYDDAPDAVDLEHFSGRRYLRYVPDAYLADVLEVQRDLILSKDAVPKLAGLADCYTIRQVCVTDPDAEALTAVCRLFDPEDVSIAGTAPEDGQNEYWKNLADLRIRFADL
ncbi:hypothetical protein [Methanorbis rubei]|uniref:Uncharacterized protein n=1 Tax=Methanorbis rubei TaxID=3028300 RepID=A0AAE4SE82_9EURY|nr:hypothetical protein [Methanocorpusculaceae archaeon Cs1]